MAGARAGPRWPRVPSVHVAGSISISVVPSGANSPLLDADPRHPAGRARVHRVHQLHRLDDRDDRVRATASPTCTNGGGARPRRPVERPGQRRRHHGEPVRVARLPVCPRPPGPVLAGPRRQLPSGRPPSRVGAAAPSGAPFGWRDGAGSASTGTPRSSRRRARGGASAGTGASEVERVVGQRVEQRQDVRHVLIRQVHALPRGREFPAVSSRCTGLPGHSGLPNRERTWSAARGLGRAGRAWRPAPPRRSPGGTAAARPAPRPASAASAVEDRPLDVLRRAVVRLHPAGDRGEGADLVVGQAGRLPQVGRGVRTSPGHPGALARRGPGDGRAAPRSGDSGGS